MKNVALNTVGGTLIITGAVIIVWAALFFGMLWLAIGDAEGIVMQAKFVITMSVMVGFMVVGAQYIRGGRWVLDARN